MSDRYFVSTQWITNTMYDADMAKGCIDAGKLKGYVQKHEVI